MGKQNFRRYRYQVFFSFYSSCKDTKIFNNGGQHWNHTFYWYCLNPQKSEPTGALKDAIVGRWGTVDKFL